MTRHHLLAHTARVAGLVAALGLSSVAWAASRWVMGSSDVDGRFFLIVFLLLLVGWILAWRLMRAPDDSAMVIWRAFTLTACGAGALLSIMSVTVAPTTDLREGGYVVQMRSDLRWLETLQEEHRAKTGAYTRQSPPDYQRTGWVSAPQITLTADGWTASVRHERLPTVTCVAFVGSTPLAPARVAGESRCSGRVPVDQRRVAFGFSLIAVGMLLTSLAAWRLPSVTGT